MSAPVVVYRLAKVVGQPELHELRESYRSHHTFRVLRALTKFNAFAYYAKRPRGKVVAPIPA